MRLDYTTEEAKIIDGLIAYHAPRVCEAIEALDGAEVYPDNLTPEADRVLRVYAEATKALTAAHNTIIINRANELVSLGRDAVREQLDRLVEVKAQAIAAEIKAGRSITCGVLDELYLQITARVPLPSSLFAELDIESPTQIAERDADKASGDNLEVLYPVEFGAPILQRLLLDYRVALETIEGGGDEYFDDSVTDALINTGRFFDKRELRRQRRIKHYSAIILSASKLADEIRKQRHRPRSSFVELEIGDGRTVFKMAVPVGAEGKPQTPTDFDFLVSDVLYTLWHRGHKVIPYSAILNAMSQKGLKKHRQSALDKLHASLKKQRLIQLSWYDTPNIAARIEAKTYKDLTYYKPKTETYKGDTVRGFETFMLSADLTHDGEAGGPTMESCVRLLSPPPAPHYADLLEHNIEISAGMLLSPKAKSTPFTMGAIRRVIEVCGRKARQTKQELITLELPFADIYEDERQRLLRELPNTTEGTLKQKKTAAKKQFEKALEGLDWLTFESFFKPVRGRRGQGESVYKITFNRSKFYPEKDEQGKKGSQKGRQTGNH